MSARSEDLLRQLRAPFASPIDLSLDRMSRLLDALGNPHANLPPVVHVAGTNGKGAVVALLRTILETSGRRVHTYTSPALTDFNECIRLASPEFQKDDRGGRLAVSAAIGEDKLASVLERVIGVLAKCPATSFEAETAAAFLAFAESEADVVIIEAGMGGAHDATNVVPNTSICVLTPIAIDHAEYLGPTLADIAEVKSGIIKPETLVVCARQNAEALDRIRKVAARNSAEVIVYGEDFDAYEQRGRMVFRIEDDILLDLPLPALRGRHQSENAGLALATARLLDNVNLREDKIASALQSVELPGRIMPLPQGTLYDLVRPGTEIWVDGGHNPASAAIVAQYFGELSERQPRSLHLVVGMLASKDVRGYLEAFSDLTSAVIAVPITKLARAYVPPYRPDVIGAVARDLGLDGMTANSLAQGIALSSELEDAPVRVLVCGSLHLAGEAILANEGPPE